MQNFRTLAALFLVEKQGPRKERERERKKFPLTPMGVLAPGSAHARPSAQPPIDVSGNFPAPVSAKWPSNISPSPSKVESEVSVSHSGIYLKLAHFTVKIGLIQGVEGGLQNLMES